MFKGLTIAVAASISLAGSVFAATVDSAATGSNSIGGFSLVSTGTMTDVATIPNVWVDNDADSQWVWTDGIDNVANENIFLWQFDLTGFDATTAVLDGLWATDNYGTAFLNGNSIDELEFGYDSFGELHVVSAAGAPPFVEGQNDLVFVVTNGYVDDSQRNPGPGGFRASVTVSATPVPLPAGGLLLIAGLGALGTLRRLNKTTS